MRDADWDRMDDAQAAEVIAMLEAGPEDYLVRPNFEVED